MTTLSLSRNVYAQMVVAAQFATAISTAEYFRKLWDLFASAKYCFTRLKLLEFNECKKVVDCREECMS